MPAAGARRSRSRCVNGRRSPTARAVRPAGHELVRVPARRLTPRAGALHGVDAASRQTKRSGKTTFRLSASTLTSAAAVSREAAAQLAQRAVEAHEEMPHPVAPRRGGSSRRCRCRRVARGRASDPPGRRRRGRAVAPASRARGASGSNAAAVSWDRPRAGQPSVEEREEAAEVGLGRAPAVLADLEGLGVLHRVGPRPRTTSAARPSRRRRSAGRSAAAQPGEPRRGLLRHGVEDAVHPGEPLVDLRHVGVERRGSSGRSPSRWRRPRPGRNGLGRWKPSCA